MTTICPCLLTSRASSPHFLCQSRGTCPPRPPPHPSPSPNSPDGYGMYRPPAGRSGSSLRHFCGSSSSISAAAARRGQGEGRGGEAEDSTFRPRPAFRPLACSPRLRHLSRGDTIRSLHAEVCLPSEHGSAQDARVCYSRDTVMGVSFVSANKAFRILSCLPACLLSLPPLLILLLLLLSLSPLAAPRERRLVQPHTLIPALLLRFRPSSALRAHGLVFS